MGGFPLEIVLALIGIAVPVGAFLWEFVFVGRKQLGYRVQMDTPVTGEIESVFPGVLPQLRPQADGASPDLKDLSVVLMRIENSGATSLDSADYGVPDNGRAGLHLRFPQRRVIGMAVTELSDPALGDLLEPDSGIAVRETSDNVGIIDLPRVPLNRADHYKILAILQRSAGTGEYPPPRLQGMIKGGRVTETRSQTGIPLFMIALIAFLVVVIVAQFIVAAVERGKAPLGCADGKLTVVGSTAFEEVIREAADVYKHSCRGARFEFAFEGSEPGMNRLESEGNDNPALLAVADGPMGVDYPALVERPLALSLFSVIVHPGTKIRHLTVEQIRDLYAGRVQNWSQLGGADLPVRLINRHPGSGTRRTFEDRLLDAEQPPARDATCREIRREPGPGRCDVAVTKDMLAAVAETPGAVGYAEHADAAESTQVATVTINGQQATREAAANRIYPFWGIEYAYSYGDFAPGSLGASFLRFLTEAGGEDVIRAAGNMPCRDLAYPSMCRPFP